MEGLVDTQLIWRVNAEFSNDSKLNVKTGVQYSTRDSLIVWTTLYKDTIAFDDFALPSLRCDTQNDYYEKQSVVTLINIFSSQYFYRHAS